MDEVKRLMPRRLGSKPAPALGATAVAWYPSEQQWAAVKAISDLEGWHGSYAEWLRDARRLIREMQSHGLVMERCPVEANELQAWCQERGLPVNGKSRSQFVSWKASGGKIPG